MFVPHQAYWFSVLLRVMTHVPNCLFPCLQARGVKDFIEHIQRNKIVYLEDLAAEFGLKTQVGTVDKQTCVTTFPRGHVRSHTSIDQTLTCVYANSLLLTHTHAHTR